MVNEVMAKRIIETFEVEQMGQLLVLEDGSLCFEYWGEDDIVWNPEKAKRLVEAISKAPAQPPELAVTVENNTTYRIRVDIKREDTPEEVKIRVVLNPEVQH
jgi:hypothetical protein